MRAVLLKGITVSSEQKYIFIDKGLIRRIEPAWFGARRDLVGDIGIMNRS